MKRDEIIQAIRECGHQLGRAPSFRELLRLKRISKQSLQAEFGSLRHALQVAGLSPSDRRYNLSDAELLLDWAKVARKVKKAPTVAEYETNGRYTNTPFSKRYQRWSLVPAAFRKFVEKENLQAEWQDVLAIVEARLREVDASRVRPKRLPCRSPLYKDRPVYGSPLLLPELAHAPTTEAGVIFLFGMFARKLGFVVLRIQPAFPDCEAVREMVKGLWQRVRIEFEYESRNFLRHRHRKDGCDIIVCWKHNWPECPKNIEVIELCKIVGQLG